MVVGKNEGFFASFFSAGGLLQSKVLGQIFFGAN
jgi:hypothetical protein